MSKIKDVKHEPFHCSLCGGGRGYHYGYDFDPRVVNKHGEAKYVCECRAEYEGMKARRTKDLELPIPRKEKDALRLLLKNKYQLTRRDHKWSWQDNLDETDYPGIEEFKQQYPDLS